MPAADALDSPTTMTDQVEDRPLTVRECTQRLGIYGVKSMTFVRDEIKAGRLEAIVYQRDGCTRYHVKASDLEAYIAKHWRYTGPTTSTRSTRRT
jgi:hypothetical protein